MAASATFALKADVWFRRGRLLIVPPDSLGTACPLSGRNSTYRPVQILEAGSGYAGLNIGTGGPLSVSWNTTVTGRPIRPVSASHATMLVRMVGPSASVT